jgi:hypothetical protein
MTAPTDTTKRLRELTPRAEALLGRIERELAGWDADWLDEFEADLAAALSAAREDGKREYNRLICESTVAVLIPHDTVLAERFLSDFNNRRAALSPEGSTEGGE